MVGWGVRLFIGGAILFIALSGNQTWVWFHSESWAPVEARITNVLRSSTTGGSHPSITVYVVYEVGGQSHSLTFKRPYSVNPQPGEKLTVLVDPRNPSRALKAPRDAIDLLFILQMMAVYIGAAVFLHPKLIGWSLRASDS